MSETPDITALRRLVGVGMFYVSWWGPNIRRDGRNGVVLFRFPDRVHRPWSRHGEPVSTRQGVQVLVTDSGSGEVDVGDILPRLTTPGTRLPT